MERRGKVDAMAIDGTARASKSLDPWSSRAGQEVSPRCQESNDANISIRDLNFSDDEKSPIVVEGCGGSNNKFEEDITKDSLKLEMTNHLAQDCYFRKTKEYKPMFKSQKDQVNMLEDDLFMNKLE
ncbi:Uncharacterized protein Fot_14685 [Forsythia ovata]|uniref:Uncharacterized protein n=1 Tax=Forsythia ovata TaxID=205694 RepID=A0ABD1W7B0_9LAMI